MNVYSENNLIIETKVMNTGKGKMKVQDALLQEIHPINVIDFTLPESIRIGTDFNTVIEKYGIPNIYMHNKNGDYQITYICSKNVDIKNIMELHFENNVLANVRLQGKLSHYEMFTTSSFQIDKALGYKPYIDITGIEKIDKIALDNASFQIDDLILTSETSIMELIENGWIMNNLDIDNTFSYMNLEKNNFEIYVAFDKIYESVADMDVNTKIAIIRLNDNAISLYKLNGKEKPTMDDVVATYGTPNEIYYDAGKTVVAYYTNDERGKILFYADVSHSLKEIRILNTQPFHGIEKGWDNV